MGGWLDPFRFTSDGAQMSREELISKLERSAVEPWDLAIVGGGAVGMGTALDAVSRGYSCVLLEQHDFCKGTSSRSTKLIHGGVRYLAQGNLSLVREALRERGLLLQNAAAVVKPLRFIVPCYSFSERWYYWAGMKCYDALAGSLGIKSSHQLSTAEITAAMPGLRIRGLNGGVGYYDAQFDDARLVIGVAQKVQQLGGVPLNYMRVTDVIKENGFVQGVQVTDIESNANYDVRARVVVNAAGAFSDDIRQMEAPSAPRMIAPSQGIHLVVNQRFLGGDVALMIPKTKDGRVLFAIPWLGRAILGTTDTPVDEILLEPKPLEDEVTYLLQNFADYLDPAPTRSDILSAYAGLRPLVRPKQEAGATSKISREHRIVKSAGGLVSVLGGKWTTFRKMAADAVDAAEQVAGERHRSTATSSLAFQIESGSDADAPDQAPSREQIVRAVDEEYARTVEDVLARRFRCLLLDARGSTKFAPAVASVLAERLGRSADWADDQVRQYNELASHYSPEAQDADVRSR